MRHALAHIRRSVFKMTQVAFAAALKVNQSTVSRWENGTLTPSGDELMAIRSLAAEHGLKWSDSWFFDPPATPDSSPSAKPQEAAP
jgi:DNA-binding transcriptional regulator YiaG